MRFPDDRRPFTSPCWIRTPPPLISFFVYTLKFYYQMRLELVKRMQTVMILFLIMTDFPLVHVKMDIMVIHMIAAQISTNANFIKFPKNYIGKLFSTKCCILMCKKCLSPTREVLQILLHVDCINIHTQPFIICQYVMIKFQISTGNSSNAHAGNI